MSYINNNFNEFKKSLIKYSNHLNLIKLCKLPSQYIVISYLSRFTRSNLFEFFFSENFLEFNGVTVNINTDKVSMIRVLVQIYNKYEGYRKND